MLSKNVEFINHEVNLKEDLHVKVVSRRNFANPEGRLQIIDSV